jgi:hypothetical protein
MMQYEWRKLAAPFLAQTATTEVYAGPETVGWVKAIGLSGAVAETPVGSFSFRVAGIDPSRRSWWRRRFSHNATVVELATQSVVASYSVGPFHRTLRFVHGPEFEWHLSFLARVGTWRRGGAKICELTRRTPWSTSGEVRATQLAPEREANILVFFGLYLFVAGAV